MQQPRHARTIFSKSVEAFKASFFDRGLSRSCMHCDFPVCCFAERSWQRSSVCAQSMTQRVRPARRRAAPTRLCWLSSVCSGKEVLRGWTLWYSVWIQFSLFFLQYCWSYLAKLQILHSETYFHKQVCLPVAQISCIVCHSVIWQQNGCVFLLHRGRVLYSRWRWQIVDSVKIQHKNPFQHVYGTFEKKL